MNVSLPASPLDSRRETEDALNILRAAVQQATEPILVTTAELDLPGPAIVFANRAFTEMSGYTADELIGQTPRIFQGPRTDRAALRRLRQSLAAGEPFVGEIINYRKDGAEYIVEWRITPVRDAQGRITHFVSVQRDVTERRRAEEALRQSEERYRSVITAVAEGIVLQDASGAIIHCNPGAERILGLTFAQMAGRTSLDPNWRAVREDGSAFPGEEHPAMITLRTGVPSAGGIMGVHKPDGTLTWISVNSQPVFRPGLDGLCGVVSSFADITQRKQAETALRESERRVRTLLESLPQMIFFKDRSYRFLCANAAFAAMFGLSSEEVIGRTDYDLFPTELAEKFRADDERVIRSGHSETFEETTLIRGRERTVEVTKAPVIDGGEVIGVVGISADITERKEIEEHLRQSQRVEAVGRLAGGIAHDFNNLLTAIAGYSALTLGQLPEGDPLRVNVEEIKKASDRAALLTKQLLAYSRRQILQPEVLDLNAVVAEMDRMLRRLIGEDVNFTTQLRPGLAPIKADRGQLEQVLMNLAVNARDAMLANGRLLISTDEECIRGEPAVPGAGVPPGRHVVLSVADTGCGIERGLLEKIFEPFFTTKEVGRGTGLGLSTVYGIVKQSGGHISVHSEVGQGTTFKIYLPAIEERVEAATAEEAETGGLESGRETILLVEDEAIVRALTQQVLEMCGYQVHVASDGREAITLAQELREEIDLLLTDVVMPEMGGRELADRLTLLKPSMRVLFMSGYTDDAIVHHGVLDDGVQLLEKPFSPDSLAAKVREILDGAALAGRAT